MANGVLSLETVPNPLLSDRENEAVSSRLLAERYRCATVDLKTYPLKSELLNRISVELMFRYQFVPLEEVPDGPLVIAIADPAS